MTDAPAEGQSVRFEADVKPLFRPRDRESMKSHFDLWSYDEVSAHADAIVAALGAGSMPCDGVWPPDRVALLQKWIDAGKPN